MDWSIESIFYIISNCIIDRKTEGFSDNLIEDFLKGVSERRNESISKGLINSMYNGILDRLLGRSLDRSFKEELYWMSDILIGLSSRVVDY